MRQGFTLLEILIVTALLSLITIFLTTTYIDFSRLLSRENLKVDLQLANQTALGDLSVTIKEASTILSSAILNGTTYTSGTSTLVLNLPTINSQGQIVSNTFDQAAYYLDPANQRKLVKRLVAATVSRRQTATKTLNDKISSLVFSYSTSTPAASRAVVITLVATHTVGGFSQTVTSTTRAVLRNK